jgi:FtsH-binding integral membrane protein
MNISTTLSAYSFKTAEQLNTAMAGVYKHMSLAVLNSMLVSYFVSNSQALMALLFGTPLKWVIIFAPLVFVFGFTFLVEKVSKTTATLMLHAFAALMGLSMAVIFAIYTSASIFTAFVGAAVLFGTMSFYGYFTKKSLDNVGRWLFVGLTSIVIASIINIFIGSTVAQMVISAISIVIFMGLTAYDTQKIREALSISRDDNAEIVGALSLYLDFINIFISLLQLFGNKED